MPSNYLSISYINGQVVTTATITGTLAATEDQDTIAVTGTVTAGSITITGTLAVTESQDTASFAGKIAHTGSLAATEAQDLAALTGSLAHVGTLFATEEPDTFSASGDIIFGFVAPPALFIVNMGRMMGR